MWLRNRSLRWIMMDRREMRRIWMGNRPPNGSRPFPTTPHRPLGLLLVPQCTWPPKASMDRWYPRPVHHFVLWCASSPRPDKPASSWWCSSRPILIVQVSPGYFNSLRQQWWPFHGGPIWWPAVDAVYPISSWSASATNRQSSQNQRPSLASIHVANCSRPMSAGHTNAHPRRRLGGWQGFSRKINKRK